MSEITIHLISEQVLQINNWLEYILRKRGFVKNKIVNGFIKIDNNKWIYYYLEAEQQKSIEVPFLKIGDSNNSAENNYITKLDFFVNKGFISTDEKNQLIVNIKESSGSNEDNQWAYSISGTDKERKRVTIDIRDRRIDNTEGGLEIQGFLKVQGKTTTNDLDVQGKLTNDIIPDVASKTNQLADKTFVNQSISTATATFRGTYQPKDYGYEEAIIVPIEHRTFEKLDEVPYPYIAENEVFYISSEDKYYVKNKTDWYDKNNITEFLNKEEEKKEEEKKSNKNDYCFFLIWEQDYALPYVLFNESSSQVRTEDLDKIKIICYRFKFIEEQKTESGTIPKTWKFEYQLNNTTFTWRQWCAINSGVTADWIDNIGSKISNMIKIEKIDEISENYRIKFDFT